MATLTQLIARARWLTDNQTDTTNFTDADITYAINRAQEAVQREVVHDFQDFFEITTPWPVGGTVAGTELYVLPTDFLQEKRLERQDTGEIIPFIDLNEKISYGNSITFSTLGNSSTSFSAYLEGNSLGITPTPQNVIPTLLSYVQRLADLVNPGDISALPLQHHDMLAVRAGIDIFIKDESDTTALENRWMEELDALRRTLRDRQIQNPKHIRQDDLTGVLY